MINQKKNINSFVKRSGRLTNAQRKILNDKNSNNNFFLSQKNLNFKELFKNNNKCILDIGFGDGKLLVDTAKKFPEINFIGLEVYDSGIGNILKQISEKKLENIKVSSADAIIFLEKFVESNCLYGITLFFPDPWPKKKHFKRRIINKYFVELISEKIIKSGFVTIATDWCNYSENIIKVFDKNNNFEKTNDIYLFRNRCLTKFEKRGILRGHRISELSYILK